MKRGHNLYIKHAPIAAAARAERGVWRLAAVYPSPQSGQSAARRVGRAERVPSYEPAGAYEAYAAMHDDGTAVWVRYIAGAPAVEPRPSSMTYRVCDRGTSSGYQGVRVVTVTVAAECPRCGGPRGEAKPHRFHEDGDWYVVDRWSNACGHVEQYTDVLAEWRKAVAELEIADRRDAIRAMRAGPADAGEYTEAVLLLNAAAAQIKSLHARQAALFLDMRGHSEAARRVQEELKARDGRMSARQAALFLADLAATRAACTRCDNGRINYQCRDGEFISLRCKACRKETVPNA
ncbi:hypothetical protein GCM10010387_16440 [Streptomyces inusitatus]|uniref:Uncharacterized protein n=1 Tax=Streptomyces inusitatus TaxID=68221 RepID=A0A918PW34_9ACTN|nr:hypothetical protein [Streptomyces inusitatus]GGZ23897.1 hypothetical protein GCM10010387_16440 [Streptomyces inusitatus]